MKNSLKFAASLIIIIFANQPKVYSDTYFGVKGGLNYASSSSSYTDYKQRYNLGWFYIYELSNRKGLALEVDFQYSEYGSQKGELSSRFGIDEQFEAESWISCRDYLQISTLLKMNLVPSSPYRTYVLAGLSSGYLINAEDKYIDRDYYYGSPTTFETDEYYNEIAYGLLIGADLEFFVNKYLILLEARYYIGLGDIYESSDDYAQNRCASISLGWGFEF